MTEYSQPWDGQSLGDATQAPYSAQKWATYWKNAFAIGGDRGDYGVIRSTGGSNTLESLQVTQNSPAAANVLVNPGSAMVNGTGYINDSTVQVTIAANASGNARIDTIVLRKTFASQIIRVAVLQGTPAATPVPVALTQTGATWEIPLADIAVANGFATITDTNITPRANYMIAPDGVYLEKVLNNSASAATLVYGDRVLWDNTADRSVQNLNSAVFNLFPQTAGAWQARSANGAYGRVQSSGIGYIRATGAARGQYGFLATGVSAVVAWSDVPTISTFCRALAASANGLTLVTFDTTLHTNWGLVATSRLTGAAASIALTQLEFHNTLVIEFYLRSAVVAAADIVNLRFGGTGALDTTATNYFSYRSTTLGVAGTTSGAENLGVTAGVQMVIPGSTATANCFAYGWLQVNNVLQSAEVKHAVGGYASQTTAVANGLLTNLVTARWLNVTNILSQLSLVSNGGSNFAIGSYINCYAKQTHSN